MTDNNIVTTVKTNIPALRKKALIIAAAAAGLIITGVVIVKNREALTTDAVEVDVDTK